MLTTSKLLLTKKWKPMVTAIRRYPYPPKLMHFLANLPPTQYTTLDNGFSVTTDERDASSVCFGLFMDAGSRYESEYENGISHFFEHIVYKSTRTRIKQKLEQQMTSTGAKFRSYTTREMAAFYVQCLPKDVHNCLDILADCVFNNAYDEVEIETQKKIVYLEMQEHDVDNNALLDDFLHKTAFQGTPLSKSIWGPSSNLYNFNSRTMQLYQNKFFAAGRTALVTVGGVRHDYMVNLAAEYFSHILPLRRIDTDYYRFCGSEIRYRNDDLPTALVAIAVEAPCLCDEEAVVMDMAAEIIGGWDRSQPDGNNIAYYAGQAASIANYAVAYRAFNLKYKDTGLWGVKFESESVYLDDMRTIFMDQWMLLCTAMTETYVERARHLLKTRIISNSESLSRTCSELAQWTLYRGHSPTLVQRIQTIDSIDPTILQNTCMQYIYDKCPAIALIGATEGFPVYSRSRLSMYWLRL